MEYPYYFSLERSNRRDKKWKATFYDSNMRRIRDVNFGAAGYEDYTIHKDPIRKERYIARHQNEDWENPMTPGALSRWILWEYPDLDYAVSEFLQRFNLHPING